MHCQAKPLARAAALFLQNPSVDQASGLLASRFWMTKNHDHVTRSDKEQSAAYVPPIHDRALSDQYP